MWKNNQQTSDDDNVEKNEKKKTHQIRIIFDPLSLLLNDSWKKIGTFIKRFSSIFGGKVSLWFVVLWKTFTFIVSILSMTYQNTLSAQW